MFGQEANNKPQKNFTSILIENIIGSKMFENKIANDTSSFFQIITLTKNKKGFRQKEVYTFRVSESEDKQENRTICETWARTIAWLLWDQEINMTELEEKETFPPRKRFFILINPKSGPGKSLLHFKRTIEPLLMLANVSYKAVVTEYAGHCTKVAMELDITAWDGVIICSGDGLTYEYLNGILKRDDWNEAIKLPVGTLPTGSGNALSASILFSAKEANSLVNALYVVLKGTSHPMDLFVVTSEAGTFYGFLSVTWGFMSDVDIESEKYRALGGFRFTLTSLQRILGLRHYRGRFSYLPAPFIAEQGDVIDMIEGSAKLCLNSDMHTSNQEHQTENPAGATSSAQRPSFPSLDAEIPSSWESIDGDFVTVGVSSLSHLGDSMYSSPCSFFDDGLLNVQFIRRGITKKRLLDVFTAFEHGKHRQFDAVEEVFVTEFRLEPSKEVTGNMAVDGEKVKYGNIHGKVLPSLANIIMMPKVTT